MPANHYLTFPTANGYCGIGWNNAGVVRFQLPYNSAAATERALQRRLPGSHPGAPTVQIQQVMTAVQRYYQGIATDFEFVPLDLSAQQELPARIYAAARRVVWGHSTTYGALAKELGAGPEGARIVGQAMASNPIPLIIPCHRVMAAGGKLGGFSAPGGAATKIRMLELEGIRCPPAPPAQAELGF